MSRATVDLRSFDNSWYEPGRSAPVRVAWYAVSRIFFESSVPWPSALKRVILRVFGARVGDAVVIKPRVHIKYPWRVTIGSASWIGEAAWLDSIDDIRIGANVCISQGAMLETGNHDWSSESFDLRTAPITIDDGAWIAVRALLLPGSVIGSHAVISAGAVMSGTADPCGIYRGNPARLESHREIRATVPPQGGALHENHDSQSVLRT